MREDAVTGKFDVRPAATFLPFLPAIPDPAADESPDELDTEDTEELAGVDA